jgi:hypothetical protein
VSPQQTGQVLAGRELLQATHPVKPKAHMKANHLLPLTSLPIINVNDHLRYASSRIHKATDSPTHVTNCRGAFFVAEHDLSQALDRV